MRASAVARPLTAIGLLTLPWILGGCAGSLFKTQVAPPTMYLLSVEGSSAAPQAGPGASADALPHRGTTADLAVLEPRVRPGLGTERIAALYPDRRLDYFADARWSGPLDEVIQDLAVQMLQPTAARRNVSGDESAFASAYWLELEVDDFEAEYASVPQGSVEHAGAAPPTVHVRFVARIGRSSDRRIIARFEADARDAAVSNRMSAIVDAFDRAANQALMQIATDCNAALASAQPSAR